MIDIKKLRDNFEEVEIALKRRGFTLDKDRFQPLDKKRKDLQVEVEYLKSEKKKLSAEFGKLKSSGEDVEPLKQIIDKKNEDLVRKGTELQNIFQELDDFLLSLPNIPDTSVPDGKNEVDNVLVSKHGLIETKNTLDHLEITKDIDIETDGIWHLACPASPKYYGKDPIETSKINFIGTYNLLEIARKNNSPIIFASTSEVYGNPEVHPQNELYLSLIHI